MKPAVHRAFRHFLATVICVALFALNGVVSGFLRVLQNLPSPNKGASLAFSGLVNLALVSVVSLVVLTPVASIANHLFTRKWALPFYLQIPALVPLLLLYLVPWSALFGALFVRVLLLGTAGLTLPLWVYWCVFQAAERSFSD